MTTHDTDGIRNEAQQRLEELCAHLLPHGHKEGHRWLCGSVHGEPGRSFSVNLRNGVFGDWATGNNMQQGPISLWMEVKGCDFLTAKRDLTVWLGRQPQEVKPTPAYRAEERQDAPKERPNINWNRYAAAMNEERKSAFADWRGLSREYVDWLAIRKLIGACKGGFALPVLDDDREIVSAHCRVTAEGGKSFWYYAPPLSELGLKVQPYALGNWWKAQRIHACESPWDALAIHERLRLYREPLTAVIATRGATNGRLIKNYLFKAREVVFWPQNDDAGKLWLAEALLGAQGKARVIARTPGAHKDVGDWVREGATIDNLRQVMTEAKNRSAIQAPAFALEQYRMAREAPEMQLQT